jgi:hypothetical protein
MTDADKSEPALIKTERRAGYIFTAAATVCRPRAVR